MVAAIGAQDLCVYNHSVMVFQLKCSLIPKNPRSLFGLRVIWLNDFYPHSHVGSREARLHLQQLWHVSMLFWRFDPHLMQQLSFCFGNGMSGKALSKKCFAGQPCECNSQVCRLRECKLSIMNCLAADKESNMYLRCTLGFYLSWGTPEITGLMTYTQAFTRGLQFEFFETSLVVSVSFTVCCPTAWPTFPWED